MKILLWLSILCGILTIIIVILSIKIYTLRKSINEICADFNDRIHSDTNVQIDISSGDKSIRYLAKAINLQLTELRKIKRQYENGDKELKEAITNISHDLRTPLTAIWGYLDLLEKKDLPSDSKRYIEQIRNRSEALKQLTEELFRYSVISSTTEVLCEKVNVCQILEETLISFEGAFAKRNIVPNIKLPTHPIWRELDISALTRIFNNIINNAIKYSDGDFSVSLNDFGNIIFSNSAKELSIVEVGKLFDRFYTVDSARKSTGLGLSIAKLLVERMNGTINADYKENNLIITVSFAE